MFRGAVLSPLQISSPSLIYRGAATHATQPTASTLEIIDRLTGPVNSIYLSLDSVDVDAALGMTVTYQGLPSLTDNWKACISFAPKIDRAVADVAEYADCLDFLVAGAGSIDALPTLTFPDTPLKAGRDVTLTFGGLPPANCGIYISDAPGQEVARHFTSRKSDDAWTLRFAEPGTRDLTITYHSLAVRVHTKPEIIP